MLSIFHFIDTNFFITIDITCYNWCIIKIILIIGLCKSDITLYTKNYKKDGEKKLYLYCN